MASQKQRRTKGDGSLFQRSNGLWVGRVELPSISETRRYRYVSSMDRNEAINKLKKLRGQILDGKITATGNTTVGKWLDKWLEIRKGGARPLRPGTHDDYARTIRLHIKPAIGRKRLAALEPEHVRQMQEGIAQTRTAQVAHVILRGALQAAVREGILARNVAEIAELPAHTATERQPLTTSQAKQLLRSLIDNGDPMATRWAAAFLLGARPGEILGLQGDRVDLVNGIADFSWQLQELTQTHGCGDEVDGKYPCGRKRVGYCPDRYWDLPRGFEHKILHGSLALTRPKTKAGVRIVPIPLPLWYMLEQHLTAHPRGADNPHDLVWSQPKGERGAPAGRPIGPRDDHHHWTAALKTAGLPHAAPYVTRHTTATLLLEAGVPEDIRMAILGHVSVTATRGYAHIDQTITRQAMTALDQLLELN
jgi:integrase